jgi:hypothetical protein
MAANMFAGGTQGFYNNQATQTNQFPINTSLNPYAGQPLGGGINNIGSSFNAAASQPSSIVANTTQPQGFFKSIGNFIGNNASDLMRSGGEYYLGQQNIEGAQRLGRDTQAGALALAKEAKEGTAFKPYTVTSGLANVQTTADGGFGINLTTEQQALQEQLQGQAGGLFGQVGVDPALAQAQLYEQMRAVQRPEEERQRLALEERMLSQGRLGLGSAAYGGSSPELLAQETARQEAMARANLGARQQSMAEQQQAASLGGMLQQAGYQPQQQALSLLEGSQIPAGYLSQGQRTGATLQGQLEQSGLEGYLQAAELGQAERLAQLRNMANIVGGSGTGANARQGIFDQIIDQFTGGVTEGTQADIQSLIDYANNPIETSFLSSLPDFASSSFLGGNGFLSSLASPQNITPSGFNQTAFNAAAYAPQQNIDASGFNQTAFNDALGL